MKYDYGRKFISKKTGLTGIEAGNIAKKLSKMNVDFETIDWESIGSNLYGHGHRTGGVKHHLKQMYGLSLDTEGEYTKEFGVQQKYHSLDELMDFFNRRSHNSKIMDLSINARRKFRYTDAKGVKKWKKNPNMYDIIGIDDIP